MSALGNYVHHGLQNYLTYGIARNGRSPQAVSRSAALTSQRGIVNAWKSSVPNTHYALKDLEERVKKAFPSARDHYKLGNKENISLQDTAELLYDKLVTGIGNGKGIINSNAVNNANINTALMNKKRAQQLRKNILRNIDTLNNNLRQGKSGGGTPGTLLKNLNEYFHALGLMLPDDQKFVNAAELENLDELTALQSVIEAMSFSEANRSILNGKIGERAVAMADDVIDNLIDTGIDEALIKGNIAGNDRSSFKIANTNKIQKKVADNFQSLTGLNAYRIWTTQDKVDVEIQIDRTPLNLTVKAAQASSKGAITAKLQTINLYNTLMGAQADFANHWLNLHALGQESADYDETLKDIMKYEALVHGNLNKKNAVNADTFVGIDVQTGRVWSATTRDLLDNAANDGSWGWYFTPDIVTSRWKFQNDWVDTNDGGVEMRIARILAQAHTVQIQTSLKFIVS